MPVPPDKKDTKQDASEAPATEGADREGQAPAASSEPGAVDLASVLVIDPRALLADRDAYAELQRLAVLAAEAMLKAQTPGET